MNRQSKFLFTLCSLLYTIGLVYILNGESRLKRLKMEKQIERLEKQNQIKEQQISGMYQYIHQELDTTFL